MNGHVTDDIGGQGIVLGGGAVIPWGDIGIIIKQNKFFYRFKVGGETWVEYFVQRRMGGEKIKVASTRAQGVFVPLEIYATVERLIKYGAQHGHIQFEERNIFNRSKAWNVETELKSLAFIQSDEAKAVREDLKRQIPNMIWTITGLTFLTFIIGYLLIKSGILNNLK